MTPMHVYRDGMATLNKPFDKFKKDNKTQRCQGVVRIDWLYGRQCRYAAIYNNRTKCKVHSS